MARKNSYYVYRPGTIFGFIGPGTVYIQNDSGNKTHRHLIIDNGQTTASSKINEFRQWFITLTGNYYYYYTSYTSREGINIKTTGSPHSSDGQLRNLFYSSSNSYYTSSSNPELTYTFPYPIKMNHLKIFPQCGSSFWTNYRVRAYLSSHKVFEEGSWTFTKGCRQGEYGKVEIRKEIDKVRKNHCITVCIAYLWLSKRGIIIR